MLFAGIDIGSLTAEAVLIDGERVVASETMNVLPNPLDSAKAVLSEALRKASVDGREVLFTVATGYGREKLCAEGLAGRNVSEISCHGLGAFTQNRSVRTIIDIGGQDAKVIKVTDDGELDNFVMNDKCAAGTGHFLEVMSKALDLSLEKIGPVSMSAKKPVEMSNRCTIYVETEVLHYLQRGETIEDIAAGINRAMAERVLALARRVSPKREIMLTGGVAKNVAVRAELERMLKTRMVEPRIDPQIMGAYGAAVFASKEV